MTEDFSVLADLEHALRGPISAAYVYARGAVDERLSEEERQRRLYAILGLCGRARQVLRNVSLLVRLRQNQPLQLRLVALRVDDVLSAIDSAVKEAEFLMGRERHVRFRVERSSFDVLQRVTVLGDVDMIEQVVRELIDNAVKYSFPDTHVVVGAQTSDEGAFLIRITNSGLRLSVEDAEHCGEYGWRGQKARLVTGEGSGIGLWLADSIMRAHHGRIIVRPTSSTGLTDVLAVLPTS
jgi:signal transduction histidine kinase